MADDEKTEFVKTLAEERRYYLGKTDIIPGTDGMTVAEGKKAHAEAKAEAEADLQRRMEKYKNSPAPKPEGPPDGDELAKMSRNDLVEVASKENVDIEAGDIKAVIIQKILDARSNQT